MLVVMISALTINNELKKKGQHSHFRATGQTGILIEGSGISVDAVVADFIAPTLNCTTTVDFLNTSLRVAERPQRGLDTTADASERVGCLELPWPYSGHCVPLLLQ